MSTKRMRISLLLAAVIVFAPAAPSRAQGNYPSRPVQLVVPVPPGGAADFIARTVGAKLADALGQPVVISNQGGAGGTIASRGVAKAEADGYTLLLNSITTHGIGPHLYASLPYDPAKDFLPIILLAKLPLIMTVNASVPARSVKEVIELAKAQALAVVEAVPPHPPARRRRSPSGSTASSGKSWTCPTSARASPSRARTRRAARRSSSTRSCARNPRAGARW